MGESKAKEAVKLRCRTLKDGIKRVYLDVYSCGKQTRVFIDGVLLSDTQPGAKENNAEVMARAEAKRQSLLRELSIDAAGIKNRAFVSSNVKLTEWFEHFLEIRTKERPDRNLTSDIKLLTEFVNDFEPDITLAGADEDFIDRLIAFIRSRKPKRKHIQHYSERTITKHVSNLSIIFSYAIKERLLDKNPVQSSYKFYQKELKYRNKFSPLSLSELKRLIHTPCIDGNLKRAFLFACFTGLRYKELKSVTWENISKRDGKLWLKLSKGHSGTELDVPLSKQASACLPPKLEAKKRDKVFKFPKSFFLRNKCMDYWAADAMVEKDLTWFTPRDTYILLLIKETKTDTYTASVMLACGIEHFRETYETMIKSMDSIDTVSLLDNTLNQ